MILVTEIHYFAPHTFYLGLNEYSYCLFEQYEHFEKRSFRNRCIISGANGEINLTVPLQGGRGQKTIMKEVRILNSDSWQENHWKSITSAYNKSPWLDHFRPGLEKLYQTRFDLLVDWNLACFQWVCDNMSIHMRSELTEEFRLHYDSEKYTDERNRLSPASINRLHPEGPKYPQVFEDRHGFIPNLSILDYMFCVGPRRR